MNLYLRTKLDNAFATSSGESSILFFFITIIKLLIDRNPMQLIETVNKVKNAYLFLSLCYFSLATVSGLFAAMQSFIKFIFGVNLVLAAKEAAT